MKTVQWMMDSKVGRIYLVASEKGLRGALWEKQTVPMVESLDGDEPEIRILKKAAGELEEYFDGKRERFEVPLDVVGTDFQKKVWEQLARIPYGSTVSYLDIANRLNNAGAIRAVGAANGKNPISIIIPCHRVIAANGALTGYAGGLEIKAALLRLESPKNGTD